MAHAKELGYNYRVGYTIGFNDGLTGSVNKYMLHQSVWKPAEELDFNKKDGLLEEQSFASMLDDFRVKPLHFKIGYNWGHLHGSEERKILEVKIPAERFERSMAHFANVLKIIDLQIRKEFYLHGITYAEPEKEKKGRINFIHRFADISKVPIPDKPSLEAIKSLVGEKKVQQAVDTAADYFGKQRDLETYSAVLSLKSRLIDIREDSKRKKLSREDYLINMCKVGEMLLVLVDAKLKL
jgi:hypothetical protein